MHQPSKPLAERCRQACLAMLVFAVLLELPSSATAAGDKTPIQRATPVELVQGNVSDPAPRGTTLVFLGLMLAGAIVIRRIVQQRQQKHAHTGLKDPAVLLSRQQIDEELTIRVLQAGPRVLVVGSSPQGLATLCEISDPLEIATMTGQEPVGETDAHQGASFDGRREMRPIVSGRANLTSTAASSSIARGAANESLQIRQEAGGVTKKADHSGRTQSSC